MKVGPQEKCKNDWGDLFSFIHWNDWGTIEERLRDLNLWSLSLSSPSSSSRRRTIAGSMMFSLLFIKRISSCTCPRLSTTSFHLLTFSFSFHQEPKTQSINYQLHNQSTLLLLYSIIMPWTYVETWSWRARAYQKMNEWWRWMMVIVLNEWEQFEVRLWNQRLQRGLLELLYCLVTTNDLHGNVI